MSSTVGQHAFFLVGLAFLLTHEMDAVRLHEWQLLPLLSRLDDRGGFLVFTGLQPARVALDCDALREGDQRNYCVQIWLDLPILSRHRSFPLPD